MEKEQAGINIGDDPKFINLVIDEIRDIGTKRVNVINSVKNGRLKASAWDSLSTKGLLNAKSIIAEANLISDKKCKLSRTERDFITDIIFRSLEKYIEIRKKEAEDARIKQEHTAPIAGSTGSKTRKRKVNVKS